MDTLNKDFASFRYACEEAPEGVFEQAKEIREMIGNLADQFVEQARALGLDVCNCDGIHHVEATMFDQLRRKNPNSEIEGAIGLGRALEDAPHDPMGLHGSKQAILAGLTRDRDFIRSMTPVELLSGDALLDAAIGGAA